jgi:hypothetical protein
MMSRFSCRKTAWDSSPRWASRKASSSSADMYRSNRYKVAPSPEVVPPPKSSSGDAPSRCHLATDSLSSYRARFGTHGL